MKRKFICYRSVKKKHKDRMLKYPGNAARYNYKKIEALYFAEKEESVVVEIRSRIKVKSSIKIHYVLAKVEITLESMYDLTDSKILEELEIDAKKLVILNNWERPQEEGKKLYKKGVQGLLVPSAILSGEKNIVVYPGNFTEKTKIEIVNQYDITIE